ncbi:MAG: hypothetical protein COU65_02420 [Candidatus Pacebacteria bacterium CG10_big_fil_rev_8_21_14_0_10_42_12]|nr:MAG: hypothetical protein COU65_02420 [Candidatus Pacebacteria bacterium CG10_big_fil_rev_8_21_14_0_10_42_12]
MEETNFLDNQKAMAELDKSNMRGSIEELGQQVQHVWQQAAEVEIDPSYKEVSNIVVGGMGGSALGTHVIQSVFKDEISVPINVVPDYHLPAYVNENTLFVASSYSGTTEETLSSTKEALKRGAKVVGITSGGDLAELLKTANKPALVFDPIHNPSGQPRMALGYSVFGQIALFSKIGLINVSEEAQSTVLEAIAKMHLKTSVAIPTEQNPAKLLAFEFSNRIPILTVAEHLEGSAHVVANQLNENAKTYSEYRVIPEINHHLLEGLQFPQNRDEMLFFLLVHSDLYLQSNEKRMTLTSEILKNNDIGFQILKLASSSKLSQAFELLTFGAYVSYYLALIHRVDPAPIPVVDWFKSQLKQ